MPTKPSLIPLLAALKLSCATASTPGSPHAAALRDIDAFVANVVKAIPEVPGIAVAVVHDGRRHTSASGYADRERQVNATPQTGFYIGSTTKAFTGVVATLLAEQGKVDARAFRQAERGYDRGDGAAREARVATAS